MSMQASCWAAPLDTDEGSINQFFIAVRSAAYAYPLTQYQEKGIQAALEDLSAARWQRFPSPSFQSSSLQAGVPLPATNRVALEQPIYAGNRISSGISAAEHRHVASTFSYEQSAQDIGIRIVNIWFELQRYRQRSWVLQDGIEIHQKLKEQVERRLNEGVSPEADLALVVARLAQIKADKAQADIVLSSTTAQLTQLSGEQSVFFLSISPSADYSTHLKPEKEWIDISLSRDPQVKKLAEEQLAYADEIDIKKSQLLPSVSLVAAKDFSGLFQGDHIYLQFSMQPGAGLSSLAAVNSATARMLASQETLRNATLELRQVMEADYGTYIAVSEQLAVSDMLEKSTQNVAESYARQFVAGKKTWLEVLNSAREVIQARITMIDARTISSQAAWRLYIRAFGLKSSVLDN